MRINISRSRAKTCEIIFVKNDGNIDYTLEVSCEERIIVIDAEEDVYKNFTLRVNPGIMTGPIQVPLSIELKS